MAIILLTLPMTPTFAGPPFLTDDPEPTEYRHLEVLPFATFDKFRYGKTIEAPALELDYGLRPNLEVNTTLFYTYEITHEAGASQKTTQGISDAEFAMTFRIIDETKYVPQVAFCPSITTPTGDATLGLGNGRTWQTYPLWAQKSWGKWILDGGGGYAVNYAQDAFNYFFGGILLQREFNDQWILGGEIFSQGKSDVDTPASTLLNLGGTYNFSETFSLLFSVGHSIVGANNLISYFGLNWVL